jgi:hypothetical protein
MRITEGEYLNLINRLQAQARELIDRYDNRNTILGIIGEKFVGYCICHSLWKLGYILHFQPYPRSYYIIPRYRADENGIGGVDFLLTIIDDEENRHRLLIEAKNWSHYDISPHTFNTEILNRFTRVDENRECIWIVTMNNRNVQNINRLCLNYEIHILPIAEHISPEYVEDNNVLRTVFGSFINDFCTLITELVPENSYPYLIVEQNEQDRTGGVIQDLLMGVSYNVIEDRYNVSKGYIFRLASYIRSFNIRLPDRRNKDWRLVWEIQE